MLSSTVIYEEPKTCTSFAKKLLYFYCLFFKPYAQCKNMLPVLHCLSTGCLSHFYYVKFPYCYSTLRIFVYCLSSNVVAIGNLVWGKISCYLFSMV
jgi:hypothetical protein